MNIVYLHGLSSSGQSATAKRLRGLLADDCVISPDIPVNPVEALQMLIELAGRYSVHETIVVGTSMGGLYAYQMKGYRRILVNPAFHVSALLEENIGRNLPFFSERCNGAREFHVDRELCHEFRQMEENLWHDHFGSTENVIALFGKHDDVCNCLLEYRVKPGFWCEFDGGHRLDESVTKHVLLPIIEWAKEHERFALAPEASLVEPVGSEPIEIGGLVVRKNPAGTAIHP